MYREFSDNEKEIRRLRNIIDKKLQFTHVITLTEEDLSKCKTEKQQELEKKEKDKAA